MRLKHYLREGEAGSEYEKEGRKVPMTDDEAKAFLHRHCKKALESTPIYRGTTTLEKNAAFFIQPSKFQRQSRNTSNHYTLLVDGSPEWKDYPKRSKSVICTSDEYYARHYGQAFRVFPVDGSKIGICPSSDFWGSFDDFKPMDMFNLMLVKLVSGVSNKAEYLKNKYPGAKPIDSGLYNAFKNANSYYDIEKAFEYVDSQKPYVKDIALNDEKSYVWMATNYLKLQEYWKNPRLELLVDIDNRLSPHYNAFDLITVGENFGQKGKVEVWTDGDCVMVKDDYFNEDWL